MARGPNNEVIPARRCEAAGCRRTTWESKPFCVNHVRSHAYVVDLLTRIEAREAEKDRLRRSGGRRLDPDGLIAAEILQLLRVHEALEGPADELQVAREIGLPYADLSLCLEILARQGRVTRCRQANVRLVRLQAPNASPPDPAILGARPGGAPPRFTATRLPQSPARRAGG